MRPYTEITSLLSAGYDNYVKDSEMSRSFCGSMSCLYVCTKKEFYKDSGFCRVKLDGGRVGGKMGFLAPSTQISIGDNKLHVTLHYKKIFKKSNKSLLISIFQQFTHFFSAICNTDALLRLNQGLDL
jgi:hypothetical protein